LKKSINIFDTRFGVNSTFDICTCSRCGLEQTADIISPEMIIRLYEKFYNFGSKETLYTRLRAWFHSSSIYRFWLSIDGDISFHSVKGSGRLIDIGCNEGRGLQIYKKNGFEVEGLEINETAAVKARKLGFNINLMPLENFKPKKSFDIVVLSNVLEHSLDPSKMLSNVHRVLKSKGEVWISCPNIESWQRGLFGKYWINWHIPFHIFHFSKNTLAKLLTDNGFQIVKEKQISPSLWLAHSIIAALFSKPNKPNKHLRKVFLVASLMILVRFILFPFLLIGNLQKKGDCLLIMAKKV
jgi:2-polyprenyl-3-methyl-5-hydroxy-6-metoxy-1,4-benzoquinol methylase